MTITTVAAGNKVTQWDDDFFAQYVRANRFKRYMGTDENSIIQIKEDLTVKKGGRIVITLIAKLTGAGVEDNNLLEGQEEALANYDFPIDVKTLRHAVATTENEEQLTEIDLRNAAKTMLKLWAMERLRDKIITALGSKNGVAYGTASEAQKDAWLVANSDRVMFGDGSVGGLTDHSADLALITSTMKLSRAVVSRIKARAELANPSIRPVTVGEDEETFVMFVGSGAFRDLKADIETVLKDAGERGKGNPLFRDGDLYWDGVVIRKIQEIAAIGAVGASGARVEPIFFCGAQALAVVWAKRTKTTTDVRDYGFVQGVGIREMRGVEKCRFNSKDHGVFTGYVAAAAL